MRPGFTLVEVIVVLMVMTLAATLSVPRLAGEARDPLEQAAASMSQLLQKSRMRALQSGRMVQLTIDPVSRRYWLMDEADRVMYADSLPLPPDVSLVPAPQRLSVRFMADGSASADALQLKGLTMSRTISVGPWTGAAYAR